MPAELPEVGHGDECCPCVERLRAQNKTSSDEWTKRTAKMTSELHGLKALMAEASDLNRHAVTPGGTVIFGLSQYGNAALAVALKAADEARAEAQALTEAMHAERRARIALENQMRNLRRTLYALQSDETKANGDSLYIGGGGMKENLPVVPELARERKLADNLAAELRALTLPGQHRPALAAYDDARAEAIDQSGTAGLRSPMDDYGSYDDLLERCEKAARMLEHQAAHEPVEVMASHLRGKAKGVRLAVSFLAEAHRSGHPEGQAL